MLIIIKLKNGRKKFIIPSDIIICYSRLLQPPNAPQKPPEIAGVGRHDDGACVLSKMKEPPHTDYPR